MLTRIVRSTIPRFAYKYTNTSCFSSGQSGSKQGGQCVSNPPGLSEAVITPANDFVGPCVDPKKKGVYKVPEYYCYHKMSYFEAEIEMAQYRLPQPSANRK